jgi:hypothetical protein
MSTPSNQLDLIVFVADKNMHFALKGALERPEALGIRRITFDFRIHPGRDGGVRTTGVATLALEQRRFSHALMAMDYEGCGENKAPPLELEKQLDIDLRVRWGDAAKAIVIAPELDVWMWGADNAMRQAINWPHTGPIRDWIDQHNYQLSSSGKPLRPKEALGDVLRECRLPRSSANYYKIASKLSLARCEDPAFKRMRAQLRIWFPPI